jgi:hypothetical protein
MDTIDDTTYTAVLLGTAADDTALREAAAFFANCPFTHSCHTAPPLLVTVFRLPQWKREWVVFLEEHPRVIGLEHARVVFDDRLPATSAWVEGRVAPVAEQTPCGSSCPKCPMYGESCCGCPATIWYRA